MPSLKPHGQMSEAFITALFLSVSGGLQDVYTYLYRGCPDFSVSLPDKAREGF